jgi:hypothetical protein
VAVAVNVIEVPAVNTAPAAGEVSVTVGGLFAAFVDVVDDVAGKADDRSGCDGSMPAAVTAVQRA